MGLKETISGLFHQTLSLEKIEEATKRIKQQIDIGFQIKELEGDEDVVKIKNLLETKQLGVAFLANIQAKKRGSFFVVNGITGDDQVTIVLCASILAHNSTSPKRNTRAFNESFEEIRGLLKAIHRDGFRLNGEQRAISSLLIHEGLWNPNEEFGLIPNR